MLKARVKNSSISVKILLGFVLLLIPLYLLGLFINQRGEANVRKEITGSVVAQLDFFARSFDREIERLISLQYQYFTDRSLMDLSVASSILSGFQQAQAIEALYGKLQMLRSSSAYIDSIGIHIFAIEKTITTQGYVVDLGQEQRDRLDQISRKVSERGPLISWDNELIIGTAYPSRTYLPNEYPQFIIEIRLSQSAIRQELLHLQKQRNGGAMLVGADWAISSSDSPEVDIAMLDWGKAELIGKSGKEGAQTIAVANRPYLADYVESSVLNMGYALAVPFNQVYGPLQSYRTMFWILLVSSMIIVLIYSIWIFRTIHRPFLQLVKAFNVVENGNLEVEVPYRRRDEFFYLYSQFNKMVRKLRLLINDLYEQKIHTQRAVMKQLQSNIHPHFLYNSFYMVHRMAAAKDIENVKKLTRHLGDYFRFITRNAGDEVLLGLEVSHSRNYAEIQSFRFGNRIAVDFGILPDGLEEVKVPKLILQPILENAFHHGLENKARNGLLQIRFEVSNNVLRMAVADNGSQTTEETLDKLRLLLDNKYADQEVTGMINVHRRLRLRYGVDGGLAVERNQWGGLTISLYMPLDAMPESKEGEPYVSDFIG